MRSKISRAAALVLMILFCIALSGCVRAEKVEGKVDVPPFSIVIDGNEYTEAAFADLPVYECKATSTNRYGTEETYVYTGYQLNDVLQAVGESGANGVTTVAADGYEADLTAKETQDATTLLAFYRDGKTSAEDGTVFVVPCKSDFTPDYVKVVEEIVVNEAA